jgi:hypothetical protein
MSCESRQTIMTMIMIDINIASNNTNSVIIIEQLSRLAFRQSCDSLANFIASQYVGLA